MAKKVLLYCISCNKPFLVWPYEVAGGRKACSFKCRPHKRWPKQTPEERFWKKINKTEGCWIFMGGKNKSGYGQFCFKNKPILAHRFSWKITFGESKECILHRCDNPPCVRPDHLFEGSLADNAHDCIKKGRFPFRPKGVPRTTHL